MKIEETKDFFRKIVGQPTSTEKENNRIKVEERTEYENMNIKYEENVNQIFSEESLINVVGNELHDEWRAAREIKDTEGKGTGKFETRIKKTKDEQWIKSKGKDEVDIANTTYKELPEDWKGENKISAEITVGEISKALQEKRNLDDKFVEEASSILHDKWLERNGEWAPESQKKSYAELSEEEKEKDRVIIKKGIEKQIEMENFKKGLKIAGEIEDIVYSNEEYWTENSYNKLGTREISYSKVDELITKKATENNLDPKYISRCIYEIKSKDIDYGIGINNPYSDSTVSLSRPVDLEKKVKNIYS